jgi:hypothetical protein
MIRNPLPAVVLGIPLAYWGWGLAATAVTGVGAYFVQRQVAQRQAEAQQQQLEAARQAQAQALASQVRSQVLIDQLTPLVMVSIPLMLAVGGFALWKAKKREEEI